MFEEIKVGILHTGGDSIQDCEGEYRRTVRDACPHREHDDT
jgi:hypothetical protein